MRKDRIRNTRYSGASHPLREIQNIRTLRRRAGRGFLQALLAIIIIGIGIAGAVTFIMLKKPPERKEQDLQAPLVEVVQLHSKDIPMVVQGYGTVTPKVEVDIIPEVAGKVIYIHPEPFTS